MTHITSIDNSTLNAWIIRSRPNPYARLRLICFPYAGGSSVIYRNWPENLPPTVEVVAIELPARGRRMREKPYTCVEQIITAIAEALIPHLDPPFAFFGHSMGALISFELTRLLQRERCPQPLHLFLSSRRAPQVPNDTPVTYNLPEPEFLAELRRINGTPKEVLEHTELLQLVLPLLRADFEICQTYSYTPGPPLTCPISVFGGTGDEDVTREHLEAWREQTTAGFSLHVYPGDHFYIHSAQSLLFRNLSQELDHCINRI